MVILLDVLKKKNNAASVLCAGISSGLGELGIDHRIVKYSREWPDGRRALDPDTIPTETKILIVPYWISGAIWDINLADVRRKCPSVKIICYTGTSPYWNGSVPCYVPENRGMNLSGLSEDQKNNFNAIDMFAVVRSRPGVNYLLQRQVGMGILPEITIGNKTPFPCVVLDAMKTGWDERTYTQAVGSIEAAVREIPDLRVIALGNNVHTPRLIATGRVTVLPGEFLPFETIAKVWSSAWAMICHNESFGYPIVENTASGTKVFSSSPLAEIPSWHSHIVSPINDLVPYLQTWKLMSAQKRNEDATALREMYKFSDPDLFSWKSAVENILA